MSVKAICEKYTAYNLWANQEIAQILRGTGEEQLQQQLKSSFSSLKATVLHIWDAEVIWLQRLQGKSISEWPSKHFSGGIEEMLSSWINTGRDLNEWVKQQQELKFNEPLSYRNLGGQTYEQEVWQVVTHICNHGTYHRGQLVTMLRNINQDQKIPATDLIRFWRIENTTAEK